VNISNYLRVWLSAIRPKTLGAAVSPILIGTAMAFGEGKGHALAALAALLGALLIQIGTNFSNDYFDYIKGADTEERLGPVRVTQSGQVRPKTMLWNFVMVFGLATLVGIYLVFRGGWPIVIIGILSIASGILYTGGPWPLGYLGLGDLFVLIFFGPVAVGGTFYVQTLEITPVVIIAGLGPGLLATALLAVNNLRDEPTLVFSAVIPFILAFWTETHWYACISALIIIPGFSSIRQIISGVKGSELNITLASTGKLILIYGILFSLGWWIG